VLQHERIKELMEKKTASRNRPEPEIARHRGVPRTIDISVHRHPGRPLEIE
jgi:hypothetical protein